MSLPGNFTFWDILVVIAMGIPLGLFLPVRPKYLLIDIVTALAFFIPLTVVRLIEGTYEGIITFSGFLYIIFLLTAYIATKFNKNAQEKEEIIKYLDEYPRE